MRHTAVVLVALVLARDGNLDLVQCGGGRDIVVVDRIDDVSADCEVVRRR